MDRPDPAADREALELLADMEPGAWYTLHSLRPEAYDPEFVTAGELVPDLDSLKRALRRMSQYGWLEVEAQRHYISPRGQERGANKYKLTSLGETVRAVQKGQEGTR